MTSPDIDDPDLPLADLFARWPWAALAFLDRRMLCPGCPIAPFHTAVDACAEYRLDEAAFRAEIHRAAPDAAPKPGGVDCNNLRPKT